MHTSKQNAYLLCLGYGLRHAGSSERAGPDVDVGRWQSNIRSTVRVRYQLNHPTGVQTWQHTGNVILEYGHFPFSLHYQAAQAGQASSGEGRLNTGPIKRTHLRKRDSANSMIVPRSKDVEGEREGIQGGGRYRREQLMKSADVIVV